MIKIQNLSSEVNSSTPRPEGPGLPSTRALHDTQGLEPAERLRPRGSG